MDREPKGGFEQPCDATCGYRVIHIHPTLQCNLSCRHCYSSSAPGLRRGLELGQLVPFLEYAFKKGFNVVSVSGGEPFLYGQLNELLKTSKRIGYKTQVASNGMLLKAARARECLQHLDLIAVSLDGTEEQHDGIRGLKGAFNKTLEGLGVLRQAGKPFGIIHTLTNESWKQLLWLAQFCFESGAKLLQLHPLELYGRAREMMSGDSLAQECLHKAYILGSYLQLKYAGSMHVQMDFLHRDYILGNPEAIHFLGSDFRITEQNFADFIKTIIVDETGSVYPISYGFSKNFQICHLSRFQKEKDVLSEFVRVKGEDLYAIISDCYGEILEDTARDLIPWTEYIVAKSNQEGTFRHAGGVGDFRPAS